MSEKERFTHGFDIEGDPLPSVYVEDIGLDEEGRWVMRVGGDIHDANALARGLHADGWRYDAEEGEWIQP